MTKYFRLGLILGLLGAFQLNAQIEITEYSASNLNQFEDNFEKFEDWIEIHNAGTTEMDISGYGISDKESKPQKWTFPSGTILGPDEYLVVWCSGRDAKIHRSFHTNFKLTQTKNKDYVVLSDPSGDIIESHKLQLTLLGHSREKNSDGEWLIAKDPTPGGISVISSKYQAYTQTPEFSSSAGYYDGELSLVITNNEPNSEIRYTTDGSAPRSNSRLYNGEPLILNSTTVVKARAFPLSNVMFPGKIVFATYFFEDVPTMPVISIAADRIKELAEGDRELRPIGSIEYFKNGQLSSSSYGELNSHGQDSWINPQRSLDWVSRDEMGYSHSLEEKLFAHSDRKEYQRFMMRCSGDDNYPAFEDEDHEGSTHVRDEYVHELARKGGMKLDVRAVSRTLVFLDGEYWGIYSPRERPVDHDYTSEYYDQGKYDLQYILTWGTTWPEYGGEKAFEDWATTRDFILDNDMSDPDNYQVVKDSMQVLGLIDYMLVNLNTVCSDWINYNTGVWRGLNPEGSHKKWGYILWDNDATFDYYINYSGVPNTNADAELCDIEEISEEMDFFFEDGGGPTDEFDDELAQFCTTVIDGSAPEVDAAFVKTINENWRCCFFEWDEECQELYDEFKQEEKYIPELCASGDLNLNDSLLQIVLRVDTLCCNEWDGLCQELYDEVEKGDYTIYQNKDELRRGGNIGSHEKLFLKLQEESTEFRQLYYSRQADMINTVFSCDNMLMTLDSLIEIIEPEMDRHIGRWGRSKAEWNSNVTQLRSFITDRCNNLSDGLVDCYGLGSPQELTLQVFPEGAGTIDFNTLKDISQFPWTGQYYSGLENLIDADPGPEYDFVRWESKNGQAILPDETSENAGYVMEEPDTLIAIFQLETSVNDLPGGIEMAVYPTPSTGKVTLEYNLLRTSDVDITISDMLGREVMRYETTRIVADSDQQMEIDFRAFGAVNGNFILTIATEYGAANEKITIID